MSAPPLPEIFGNYALGKFAELVSPDGVSWLPQTIGWLWLGLILGALLGRYLWRRLRHWYRNRYRREAIVRLQELEDTAGRDQLVNEVNRLLKLTALAAWSRSRVARLTGEPWVNFLNQACQPPPFDTGLSQLLATGTYTGEKVDDRTGQHLLSACRTWILEHRGPADA